jgi:hypothetical protein
MIAALLQWLGSWFGADSDGRTAGPAIVSNPSNGVGVSSAPIREVAQSSPLEMASPGHCQADPVMPAPPQAPSGADAVVHSSRPHPSVPQPSLTPSKNASAADLDELYRATLHYKTSTAYRGLLDYIARFRNYSSYNIFLVKIQKPDAGYVATAKYWKQAFSRRLKPDAKPLIMLQPGGPVMFVYDISDTEGKPAPTALLDPFHAEGTVPELVWKRVLKNCEREGFVVLEQKLPKTRAGWVEGHIGADSVSPYFRITLNADHEEPARFVTLAHELAHVYCGHLGGHPMKRWPNRSQAPLDTREFEAESAAYLVAKRRNIESGSERYLSDYLRSHSEIPGIDVELVVKVADRIETMGHALRPLRKDRTGEKPVE